jgi:hypothetical protein
MFPKWKAEAKPTEASEPSPVGAIETVLRLLEATLSNAATELANAEAALQSAETAEGAAKMAHDATPTDEAATAEHRTGVALARATRVRDAARARLASALTDVGNAEAKLADARREVRRGELREAASPATLAAAIEKPWARLIAGDGRPSELAEMIRSACADSLAASRELRSSFGEAVFDLDHVHAILPGLRALADTGQAVLGRLEHGDLRRIPLTGPPSSGCSRAPIHAPCLRIT